MLDHPTEINFNVFINMVLSRHLSQQLIAAIKSYLNIVKCKLNEFIRALVRSATQLTVNSVIAVAYF